MAAKGLPVPLEVGVLQPPGSSGIDVLLAAGHAGALPILDAPGGALSPLPDPAVLEYPLGDLLTRFGPRLGIRVEESSAQLVRDALARRLGEGARLSLVIVAGTPRDLGGLVASLRTVAGRVFREAVSRAEGQEAVDAGADGVIAKGNESGGRVGSETTFVLLQRLCRELPLPVWAQGGIGPHALGACGVAGAAGVVLDSQFGLAEESSVSEPLRRLIAAMDGSETVSVGESLGQGFRAHRLRGASHIRALRELEMMNGDAPRFAARLAAARAGPEAEALFPIGQEAAFARSLASRYQSVAGILRAYRRQAVDDVRLAAETLPLAEGSPLARSHGTRFSIVQGPMTRVSDIAAFACSVAEGGALPFLALALLREGETERLLREAAEALGHRPWGVGILGFVPPEIRGEQLTAVLKVRPPVALLAGGRPDQAHVLRTHGIVTYLHAPSVRLLDMFLEDGARHFVLEGRECGGHVGPLSSLMLWQTALEVLLKFRRTHEKEEISVLFAGGIHDATSAAMVSALAATAAAAGIRIGVLMGTAYLFTREAVADGAIVPAFQEEALRCDETVLLDMEGGHAIRCAPSRYAEEFTERRRELLQSGVPIEEARGVLEQMNLGRLRIASKGVARRLDNGTSQLVPVSPEQQAREGMYMIGQIAALRRQVQSIAELHQDVAEGSAELLRQAAVHLTAAHRPAQADRESIPVAIIGMAALFPGASDVRRFWSNVLGRRDAIREVPPERWRADLFFHPDPQVPDRFVSRWGGFLDPIPFDPVPYGIPPASLWSIEPMQLLMLEVARRALADAGYDHRPFDRERAGVVIGAGGGPNDLALAYQTRVMVEHYLDRLPGIAPAARDQVVDAFRRSLPELTEDSFPGVLPNVAAGRVANRFNLGGPNLTVDAACASSLAALEVAAKELRHGACDMVLAGAADTQMSPFSFLMFSKTHALSPKGRCRPFDAQADGISISEGVAMVILKRLEDALTDGDRIYAVLRGVAGASDGRDKSLTAPSTHGQQRALTRAYATAGISPATVGLVEAHGTGTVVGDRTEMETLRAVYEAAGAKAQSCALGSVKSQIGHTKNAAGLAGLIKTALALHHQVLPPTLVGQPSEATRDHALPFYLNTRARPWLQVDGSPRRGAVSAFGFGGTNFHAVLEEFPGHAAVPTDRPAELFLFRGASRAALAGEIDLLLHRLEERGGTGDSHLADLALAVNRRLHDARGDSRLAIVAADPAELGARLAEALRRVRGEAATDGLPIFFRETPADAAAPTIAFLFPGQGSQALHMLQDLAVYFPPVRETFQQAERLLAGVLPVRLSDAVFPPPAHSPEEETAQRQTLNQTWYAQPALGAADYAMFSLLASLGIHPAMVGGHSYGEYAALCAAGCFGFADLIAVSEARGRAVQETQGRDAIGMVAVRAAAEAVQEWIGTTHQVHVAGSNAPAQTIVGGAREAMEEFARDLDHRVIAYQVLPMSAGFHIPEAGPAAERVAAALAAIGIAAPRIPVYSNGTARLYPTHPEEIRRLLIDQLTRPLRFQEQIAAMYDAGARIFVEVGPGQVLTGLVQEILADREGEILAASPANSANPVADFLLVVGALFTAGVPVNWEQLFAGREVPSAADLGPRDALPSTTWLVDGSKATPLGDVKPPSSRRPPSPAAPAPPASPSRGATAQSELRAPAGPPARLLRAQPDGKATEVMAAFQSAMRQFLDYQERAQQRRQRLMEQFLETQRAIVEAYVSGSPLPLPESPLLSLNPAGDGGNGAGPAGTLTHLEGAAAGFTSPPAAPASGPAQAVSSPSDLLLGLVSERTGYPVEMLDLDHNMEADLGIDSIKRTEIFAALRERLGLRGDAYEQEEYFVAIARLRTLREVLVWLEEQLSSGRELLTPRDAVSLATVEGNGHHPAPDEPEAALRRFVVRPVAAPLSGERREVRDGEVVLLTEDSRGIGRELGDALRALGHSVIALRHAAGTDRIGGGASGIDLLSFAAVEAFRRSVIEEYGRVTALCHLMPLDALSAERDDAFDVKSLFLLARAFAPDLRKTAGTLIAFTAMGGLLGRAGSEPFRSGQAAVTGLLKSAALEWPEVFVKAIDVDPSAGREYLSALLLAEVSVTDRTVEAGYATGGRIVLRPVQSDLDRTRPRVQIDSESVILATGGARGITGAICAALAERYRPRLILVGRSPLPGVEDPETAEVEPAELKRIVVDRRRRRGQLITPASVEEEYQALMRAREIRMNLERLRAAGAAVEYHPLDVRDAPALENLVDSLYRRFGRLDGVIHGAGVLRDGLLADKSMADFEEVYDTKVTPALALARCLRPASLQFLAFFSSVAARFGNTGQADYAAANEVLNKLACRLDADWPARVVSIGWGPWDGVGMLGRAGAELRGRHRRSGLRYHSVRAGCERFIDEITFGRKGEPEVLVFAPDGDALVRGSEEVAAAAAGPDLWAAAPRPE